MQPTIQRTFYLFFILSFIHCGSPREKKVSETVHQQPGVVADSILDRILELYAVPHHGLLTETYPVNPNHQVDYLADGSAQKQKQEVSFLWPYSGVISGVVSLYKETKDSTYLSLLEGRLLPGLDKYFDASRQPAAYQSYPVFAGHSDRFYDDNVWLALDFCSLYESTGNTTYLDKALLLYEFIYSGWDDKLGGGIYWCEQKKESKNTCSNAPGAVLCARLFTITGDSVYLHRAIDTYQWTKQHLLDPSDHVYWDNISLTDDISKHKYTYNSGQMIEAGVLLYRATRDTTFLRDAQQTAEGSFKHFASNRPTTDGEQLFYPSSPWFNTILFRGLKALYAEDGNEAYVSLMRDNAYYALNHSRDENGLFGNSWNKPSDNRFKWLLDNACMIELFSEFSSLNQK